jgi:hypothetical protein
MPPTTMTTAELYVRLTRVDAAGDTHLVEFPIDPDVRWDELWEVAHRNADGTIPSPQQLGSTARDGGYLRSAAHDLRKAEQKLAELCGGENEQS